MHYLSVGNSIRSNLAVDHHSSRSPNRATCNERARRKMINIRGCEADRQEVNCNTGMRKDIFRRFCGRMGYYPTAASW